MNKISLCLGYFDSVHLGHCALIKRSAMYAKEHNAINAVYTFREDSIGMFDSLYTFDERSVLLKNAGADLIISDIFSQEFKQTSGKDFLDKLLKNFNIEAFFCGFDYTFGKDASCNAQFLLDYATHNKIYSEVLPPVEQDEEKISTSRIKRLLTQGKPEEANKLLTQPYHMTGKVVHGRGVGKGFGIPTANIIHDGFLPLEGVYKTIAHIGGQSYNAVTSIGSKPTFSDESKTIETMIVGFIGNLYDKEMTIEFMKYLRPICKFKDGNELSLQIQKDIKEALC